MKKSAAMLAGALALVAGAAPCVTFAKVPALMMERSGETDYAFQSQDVDNTSGGSGLLALTPLRNGAVKVSEEGNAAYSDVKNLKNGSAEAGAGSGFAVGNLQPDGTIQVIPEGRTIAYFNVLAGILDAGPDHPKVGDTWNADVPFTQSTGQALLHLTVVAKVTDLTKEGMTISFDGTSDDKLSPGHTIIPIKIRVQTHTFGTMTVVKGELETAEGETDSTVMKSGHNEKWSMKRA
jgi:hypothetical protein